MFMPKYLVGLPLDRHPELLSRYLRDEIVFSNGVWRQASNQPLPGAIVAHSRQLSELSDPMRLMTGLGTVAAGASLLTLGVSVAGFALMHRRLRALEAGVARVHASLDRGFNSLHQKLDGMEERLIGATQVLHSKVEDLEASLDRLRDELRDRELARLVAVVDQAAGFDRFSPDEARDALAYCERTTSEVVPWLERQLDRGLHDPGPAADTILFVQWFGVAVVVEGSVHRARRSPAEGAARIRERLAPLRPRLVRVARALADNAAASWKDLGPAGARELGTVLTTRGLPDTPTTSGPDRLLLAASIGSTVSRLESLAAEWDDGDPRLTDPFARWALPDNERGRAEILLIPSPTTWSDGG